MRERVDAFASEQLGISRRALAREASAAAAALEELGS
jgi:hypothetical protein